MRKNSQALVGVVALVVVAVFLTATTLAALSTNKNLTSYGSITVTAQLGVYSDSACTIPLSTVNWGSLSPGGSTTKTLYIKNTGAGASLTLGMSTSSWSPSGVDQSITITWNKENTRLAPGESTAATLTLTVSQNIADTSNFSVQISITGTQ